MSNTAADSAQPCRVCSLNVAFLARHPLLLQNVLLTESGRAKIADVGLSQVLTSTAAHLSRPGAGGGRNCMITAPLGSWG